MLYMVTFTINIPQMLAYIPYMDPMGYRTLPYFTKQSIGTYRTNKNWTDQQVAKNVDFTKKIRGDPSWF